MNCNISSDMSNESKQYEEAGHPETGAVLPFLL